MLKPLVRPLYHRLYRSAVRAWCHYEDYVRHDSGLPPAMLRFRVIESASPERFIDVGRGCAEILTKLPSLKRTIQAGDCILDFGCGCGRTIRWLIEQHPDARFFGCDVDKEAVGWCQKHLPGGTFQVNDPSPPLNYGSSSFDTIYCFSVFTHLNETMQDAWLNELRRVLKPDGFLVLTVHGRNAAKCLSPADQCALQAYGFLHRTSRKLAGFLPDWYHTTWHTESYILKKVAGVFGDAAYFEIPDGAQDFVLASTGSQMTR